MRRPQKAGGSQARNAHADGTPDPITCNLAAIGASQGLRTLVIDLDVQGNSTHYLVGEIDAEQFPAEAQGVAGLFKQTVGPRKMNKNRR